VTRNSCSSDAISDAGRHANAVWALLRFGIRSVIALGFSDIFRENASGWLAASAATSRT
jgi:3-isopropylmalate dehydratase small subunit